MARLKPLQYVELHALRQFVARERPGAGGLFTRSDLPAIVHLVGGGSRVRSSTLARLLDVGLVRSVRSYSEAELVELEEAGRASFTEAAAAIREARDDVVEALRLNRW